MYDKVQSKIDEEGVSPVIGVILMVAVTVALVALVTVIVFDIGGDVSESPDATIDISVDEGDTSASATILRNENVDSFTFQTAGGTSADSAFSDANAGSTAEISTSLSGSGTLQVIATMSDGSEQVLTTTDYNFS
jgi:flagellin-like protein